MNNYYGLDTNNLNLLIDTLLYIFEKIYSILNKKFLIIESNNPLNPSKITNRLEDIIKMLNIENTFYQTFIKNYVADHLKHYSYYSTFSLLLFLHLLKKASILIEKWKNKKEIAKYFEKVKKEILKITKEMKIIVSQKQILKNAKKCLLEFEDYQNQKIIFENILKEIEENENGKNFKIKVTYIYNFQENHFSTGLEKAFRLKYDENHANTRLIEDFFDSIKNSLIFQNENILLIETDNLNIESALRFGSNPLDLITKLLKKKIGIVITNGILSDFITFSFFGNQIVILGNVKLKSLRSLSIFLETKVKSLSELDNDETLIKEKKNDCEVKILKGWENKNYLIFKNPNSKSPYFNVILPYFSEPSARRMKYLLKTTIQKFRILTKFKKCLIGEGVFELKIAEFLKVIKKNKKNELSFIQQDVREAVSDVFEGIVIKLLENEGYDFKKIKKYMEEKKELNFNFLDEYKCKKHCIKSAFYYVQIFMKSIFFQKN